MRKIFFLLPAMALFTGCANQDNLNTEQLQNKQIVVKAEKSPWVQGEVSDESGTSLRTSIDVTTSPMTTYWSVGDAFDLMLINNNDFNGNTGGSFMFNYVPPTGGTTNEVSGRFTTSTGGTISPGRYIAFYPYSRAMLVTAAGTQGNGDVHLDLYGQNQNGSGSYNNYGTNAFMYTDYIDLTTEGSELKLGIDKESSGFINFKHTTALIYLTIKAIPVGTKLYQIQVKSPETLWRTTAITPLDGVHYVNPTPSIKFFTDDASGNGVNEYVVDNTGTYKCVIVVNPGLSVGGYMYVYIRSNLGCHAYSLKFPEGVKPSYYYPISPSWTQLTKVVDVWDGTSYTIPHIVGNNILIRTATELRWVSGVCNRYGYVPNWDFGGVTGANNPVGFDFTGYTITLANDINLNGKTWRAIGMDNKFGFNGTFDGAGHNISNFIPETTGGSIFQRIESGQNGGHVKNLYINGQPFSYN